MKQILRPIVRQVRKILRTTPGAPAHLRQNHRRLTEEQTKSVEQAIRTHYHRGWRAEEKYTPEAYRNDLENHLRWRMEDDRNRIIPWISTARSLNGMRILELGCGTGSSTVALAEQGAIVTGVDIDTDALKVAEARCLAHGVQAAFESVNGDQILERFGPSSFDAVIFFACLEHMTVSERISSLRQAWEVLPGGGLLIIVETPNRLWFRDDHTALLPLYHWLPNELAFHYSRFSDRTNFRELYRSYDTDSKLNFLRRGRGMSFHEIELAIAPLAELKVVSSLGSFPKYRRSRSKLGATYQRTMRQILPDLHPGFMDEYLDLILVKAA